MDTRQTLNNPSSSYDFMSLFILFAMLLKACALIPIIVKVVLTKSAEDISLITPIMFLISFSILIIISLIKGLFMPLTIFIIGITASIVLLIQKIMYEKSKYYDSNEPNYEYDPNDLNIDYAPYNLNQKNNIRFSDL